MSCCKGKVRVCKCQKFKIQKREEFKIYSQLTKIISRTYKIIKLMETLKLQHTRTFLGLKIKHLTYVKIQTALHRMMND
jgi:hypothetical protein